MFYDKLKKLITSSEFFDRISKLTKQDKPLIHNLNISAKALVAAHLFKTSQKNIIFVSSNDKIAEDILDDFDLLVGRNNSFFLPDYEILPYENRSPHYSIRAQRIDTLVKAVSNEKAIYTLSVGSFFRKIVSKEVFSQNIIRLTIDNEYPPDVLISNLVGMGYDVQYQITHVGQVAHRGGIIDVFSPNYSYPIRIEFFGDTIDSIRFFSVSSQVSTNHSLDECVIIPAREFSIHNIETDSEKLWQKIHQSGFYEGIEEDVSLLLKKVITFAEYFEYNDVIIIWNDLHYIKNEFNKIFDETKEFYKRLSNKEFVPLPRDIFQPPQYFSFIEKNYQTLFLSQAEIISNDYPVSLKAPFSSQMTFESNLELFIQNLSQKHKEGYKIIIQSDNKSQSERLKELLDDLTFGINFTIGVFHKGFLINDIKLAIYTDHEIFSRYKKTKRIVRFSQKDALVDYDSLKPGDYIVHITHGIGIYQGLKKLNIDGNLVECLMIAYAGNDKIYVPIDQLRLVSKYVAQEGIAPVIHKLGSKKWLLTKNKAKKQIELVAKDLLELYAKRRLQRGIKFDKDTLWQAEMEDAFVYEDTPDQKRSTEEIKKDMESDYPMERLLCGDVGFGKTEVAIRAAFKAVLSGYQVAVLVPTTLLAEQHYLVFKERMAAYPIKITMVSRFRKKSELDKDIKKIFTGEIDIAIGTHKLLSQKIKFKKLGLLIIDEEHKFGVRHKDKLRKLKNNVDTLYMSATPIPRTMNMALSKLKEMSLIQTSPVSRLPIRTIMTTFDDDIIKDAIKREIARGGQVFFVHNRVQTIDTIAEKLKNLLPDVKFAVGHGQLSEKTLEKVMLDFAHHKFDVLIATTIIESGIDIPNANTIIINRADRFGLAQLYQIRGRVGRSNKRAYAYFIVPENITETAKKRLETLLEYESLGSGYQIAMRDLEIRGAGTLLGTKQSGIINTIGFNYYSKLLNQAVEDLQNNPEKLRMENDDETVVKTAINRFIPSDYISDEKERLKIYERLLNFDNINHFEDIKSELKDRFGKIPPTLHNTISHFKIRFMSNALTLKSFRMKGKKIIIEFKSEKLPKREIIEKLLKKFDTPVSFDVTNGLKITFELTEKNNPVNLSEDILYFLYSNK